MTLVPSFGRLIPTTPTPKTRTQTFELGDSGIDVAALAASGKRRAAPSAAPAVVFGERTALLLPLLGLAACGGGGAASPPGPAPAPPSPALTVKADTGTITVGAALEDVTNVLTNDPQITGTTVSAVVAGATAGTGGVGAAVAGSLGSLTVTSVGVASYTTGTAAVALADRATGTDTFTYTASNSGASPTTASTTVTITVTGINDAPIVVSKTVTVASPTSPAFNLDIPVGATGVRDPDTGDTITITAKTLPTKGEILLANGTVVTAGATITVADLPGLRFNPDPAGAANDAAVGSYSFVYTVTDGRGATTDGTITLAVGPSIRLGAGVAGVVEFMGAAGFGASIAGGVDINGDGIRDFVVGAPNAGNGSVSVFSTNGASGTATVLNGAAAGDRFGTSIAVSSTSIGGSAAADLVVGAPGVDAAVSGGGPNNGRAYIIFGQGTLAVPDASGFGTTNGFVFNGTEGGVDFTGTPTGGSGTDYGTNAGFLVAALGDVNNDTRGDYLIGFPGQILNGNTTTADNDVGAAAIAYGPATPSLNNDLSTFGGAFVRGAVNESAFPTAAAGSATGAASFNGAGGSDIAIGDGLRQDGGVPGDARGYVYVINDQTATGGVNLGGFTGANGFSIRGADVNDRFGTSVAFGDVNGDGRADLIIGAPGADVNGLTDNGAVYIVFGGTATGAALDLNGATFTNGVSTNPINGLTVARIAGGAAGQGLGASVAFVGSFDGTGGDFAVGTNGTNGGSGDAYVINGGAAAAVGTRAIATPDGTNVTQLDGTGTGTVVVSALGNINGTGGDDLGVGIASSNSAFIVYGKNAQGGTSLSATDTGLSYDSGASVDALINHFAGNADSASAPITTLADFALAMPQPAYDPLTSGDFV